MTHLNEALRLAELGWQVFALGPTGKPYPNCKECRETCTIPADYELCQHPLCHATYAGTDDAEVLKAVWGHLPHSLIGIRTGAVSGLIVFDFDLHTEEKDGSATARQLRKDGILPATVSAQTGGGGLHLYYRHPGIPIPNDNRGKLGPGADVKGEGGFVIAPPSAKRGKDAYWWIPGLTPWDLPMAILADATVLTITKSDELAKSPDPEKITQSNDPQSIARRYEEALITLRDTGVGGRNENLYRAACRGGEMIASGQAKRDPVYDNLSDIGAQAGLTSSEIRQTIRSGVNRGLNDYTAQEAQRD